MSSLSHLKAAFKSFRRDGYKEPLQEGVKPDTNNDGYKEPLQERVKPDIDNDGLCPGCSGVISSARQPPQNRMNPESSNLRGISPRIRYRMEPHDCLLCPLLLDTFPQCLPKNNTIRSNGYYIEMVEFSLLPDILSNMGMSLTPDSDALAGDTTFIAATNVLPHETHHGSTSDVKDMERDLKSFIALYPDEKEGLSLAQTKIVSVQDVSLMFDPAPVREWLERCQLEHSSSCSSKSRHLSNTLRLVDCVESQICRHSCSSHKGVSRCKGMRLCTIEVSAACLEQPGYEYLALSYVWGETKPAKWEGDECADPKPPSSIMLGPSLVNVATTIADAIEVTTALNRRYLWVDQYCIDQDNSSQRRESISQMRRIYEKADVALVAAAGKDANHGLPGMHSQMRTRSQTLKVAGVTVRCVPSLPQKDIKSSVWATRGWTYEEAFLSRRRLVFLDDQVYFECKVAHSCDRISASPSVALRPLFGTTEHERAASFSQDNDSYHNLQILYGNEGPQSPEGHQGLLVMVYFALYMDSVVGFTSRTLTHEWDSLNAFRGMIEKFQDNTGTPIYHIWGAPFAGSPTISSDYVRFFATGISWIHRGPRPETTYEYPLHATISVTFASRRPKFPSWSWTGWKGELYFPGRCPVTRGPRLLENVVCQVLFRDTDSGVISRLEDIVQHNKSNRAGLQYPRTLVLEAPVIPLKDLLRDGLYEDEVTFRLDVKDIQDSPEYWRRKLTKGKDIQCVGLGTFPGHYIGLVLARNKEGNGNNRKTYYRIGTVTITDGRFNDDAFKSWDLKTFEIE